MFCCVYVCILSHFSHIQLCATLWTIACQAPLSIRFSRQEYWSGLPCPPPGDLPDQGMEPRSLMFPALAGRFFTTCPTWEAQISLLLGLSLQSIQSLSHFQLFATLCTTARQASLSTANPQSLLKLISIEPVMPSNHLILCFPLLLLPSTFPSIRVFSKMSQFFASGGQSIGVSASASVLPMSTQD